MKSSAKSLKQFVCRRGFQPSPTFAFYDSDASRGLSLGRVLGFLGAPAYNESSSAWGKPRQTPVRVRNQTHLDGG